MTDHWQSPRVDQARRMLITREAHARMKGKTARQQLLEALQANRVPANLPEPDDADDASAQPGVLK